MGKYEQLTDEHDSFEIKPMEIFKLKCCDCGLVHNVCIAVGKRGKEIGVAMRRNKRSTAQFRRKKK